MAIQLFLTDEPDCAQWAYGQASDFLRSIVDPTDFTTTYDIRRVFPDTLGQCAFQPGLTGEGFFIDPVMQVAYLIRDGLLKVIAGVYGFTGLRDGAGNQALLGAGGLQAVTYGAARDSSGNWYSTDGHNNRIRKFVEEMDGTWTVSSFATVSFPNTIAVDSNDNIWTIEGSNLKKFDSGGSLVDTIATPSSTIIGIGMLANDHILMMTRNNSWDIAYNFDPDTEISTRVAGMNDAEVAAYQAANGFILVDGAAIGEATFHSAGISASNADGSLLLTGGGDERQIRKIEGGRVSSLFPDGQYYETQDRIGGSTNNDPNRPFYVVQPFGLQGNGYPWVFPFTFIPQGGIKSIKAITPVEVGDPPPTGGINNASFISQVVDTTLDAGQAFSFSVTMRNTGTSTWSEALLYRLGSQNPPDNITWMPQSRAFITGNVAPNTNYTFTIAGTAPALAGQYNFQTKMVRDGVAWFGAASPNVVITVAAASPPTTIGVTLNLKL